MNRVTDTCIPEMEAMRRIENEVLKEWVRADQAGERFFPHEFMYKILLSGDLEKSYQIDPKNSWLLAAAEKNLPIFVPGWKIQHSEICTPATSLLATSRRYTRFALALNT